MVRFGQLSLLILATFCASALSAAETPEVAALRTKAEKGNGLAMYNLGLAYAEGDGVEKNLSEAFVWLSLSSENGATGKALDSVLGNITDAQLAEGRRKLTEYRAALAARVSVTSSQTVVRRPINRGFTLTTIPGGVSPPVATQPSVSTISSVSSTPRTVASTEPLAPGLTPPDELTRVKAELARANSKIAEQAATISRLQEEQLRRLPITSVSSSSATRTSPADGAGH